MIQIKANSPVLLALIASATALKLTHARALKENAKRAVVVDFVTLKDVYSGYDLSVEFGTKENGMPFEVGERQPDPQVLGMIEMAKAVLTSVESLAPEGANVKDLGRKAPVIKFPAADGSKTVTDPTGLFPGARRGTGYIAYIDELLLDTEGVPVSTAPGGEKFLRSRHTVNEAVQLVLKRFPGHNPGSVKRVAKVRPRHLERAKTVEKFSDDATRAPRWKALGYSHSTDYMKRMDALIIEGLKPLKEIAEIVAKEFGKDVEPTLATIQSRATKLRAKLGEDNVGTKPARATGGRATKVQETKAKNLELLKKRGGKPSKALVKQAAKRPLSHREIKAKKKNNSRK